MELQQPLSTIYGGGHLFTEDTPKKLRSMALQTFNAFIPDARALESVFGMDASLAGVVYERLAEKLEREPVEDFRIDFEDGYGYRDDATEDSDAERCGHAVARAFFAGSLPPFIGIRVKAFTEASAPRAVRTLQKFFDGLLSETGVELPANSVITLPKVGSIQQVLRLCHAVQVLEERRGLPDGCLKIELMVEEPVVLSNRQGRCLLADLVEAAGGRCRGMHFGAYDYTSALGIVASQQRLDHPACDHARQVMLTSLCESGVWLSDGATTVLPIAPHRGARNAAGGELTPVQAEENRQAIVNGLKLHYKNVRHALGNGFYQGWDLHPAQLPARYAAVFAFFLEALESMEARMRAFEAAQAQASMVGAAFDDAATGRGLRNFFARARACGALV